MPPPIWLMILVMEVPALVAILDCIQRPDAHFEDGARDRSVWTRLLVVAILTVPIFVGYVIILGYYHTVIRRNTPTL